MLKEEINFIKSRDLEISAKEKLLEQDRKDLKLKMQNLGRMLESVGLESFSSGEYTLHQQTTKFYSIKDEEGAKRELIELFDREGLFDEYVKIDSRSLSKQVRLLMERGIEIPQVKETEKWTCKITKG